MGRQEQLVRKNMFVSNCVVSCAMLHNLATACSGNSSASSHSFHH